MSYISKITVPTGTYDIKDNEARELIEDLQNQIYTYHPVLGVQIDFKNNVSQRLAASYDTITGTVANFNDFDVYSKRTRCTVADDGTINHFFGETGYIEDGSDGQVMVYQPKFYYKVEPVSATKQSDGYDLDCANYYISSKKAKGFKTHPAFIDDDGNEVNYYLVAAFDGVLTAQNNNSTVDATITGYLSSFAAANTGTDENPAYPDTAYASTSLTRSDFERTAQNRGANWHICTYKIQAAEQLLMMIEFGTMNLQGIENETVNGETVSKAIGGGLLTTGTSGVDFKNNTSNGTGTGYRIGLGGSTIETVKSAYNDYTSPIVYRGLENPWGNVIKWIDGISYNGTERIAYIANTNFFTENIDTDYTSCGFLLAGSNGFISAMGYNENMDWVLLPSKVESQNIGIVGDYYYQSTGWRVAQLNGDWYYGSSDTPRSGAFCWLLLYDSSFCHWTIGARAAYCPQKSENSYSINLNKIKSLS